MENIEMIKSVIKPLGELALMTIGALRVVTWIFEWSSKRSV